MVTGGLPARVGRIGVAVAPSDPKVVYAIVDAAHGGLFRSDNGGRSFRLGDNHTRIWGRGWYFGGVTVDPQNANVVYVANTSTYRSTNGGHSFTAIKGAPGGDDYHSVWVAPADVGQGRTLLLPARVTLSAGEWRAVASLRGQVLRQFRVEVPSPAGAGAP